MFHVEQWIVPEVLLPIREPGTRFVPILGLSSGETAPNCTFKVQLGSNGTEIAPKLHCFAAEGNEQIYPDAG